MDDEDITGCTQCSAQEDVRPHGGPVRLCFSCGSAAGWVTGKEPYTERQLSNMTSARDALDAIHLVISAHPDLRVGQIISLLTSGTDTFYIDNEMLEHRASHFAATGELPKL